MPTSLPDATETVRLLSELMTAHGLTRLDLTVGDVAIRLRANGHGAPGGATGETIADDDVPDLTALEEAKGHVITAPMIGTYYASPSPGEAAFVRVGDTIESGQVIGIIEAMKIMNEIPADRSGIVTEIMVANAQAVEYGSPLMRIVADEDGSA